MRDDKIRNALMKMEPDAMLSAKIDAMVDAADLTPREPAVRRVKRPAKAMLIAAAVVVMMAMAVSAVGVFTRLFYLPGAGLVDESGVLVIKEDDIGELDVVAYRTASELELGGYVLEDSASTPELASAISARIKLLSSFLPGESFIYEKGRVIAYGFFDNAEEAKKLLKSFL